MRLVLDSTGEGLVAVNLDGSLRDIRSKIVADWFADDEPVWSGLFPDDAIRQQEMALVFEGISEGFMPFEVLVDQMPRTTTRGGRIFEIELRLVADGEARWLLMVIRDTTAREAQAKAERQNQELVRVVQMLSRDRTGFIEFMEEMDRLLDITAAPDLSFDALKGVVHTLKGNAAIFGFLSFAERCHALESRMAAEGEIPQDAAELGAASDLDLVHALFTPGLSTRDQASEISGRGIGMAEVRSQAEQAGGTVSVESSGGSGSAFVFRFPAPGSGFTQDLKPARRRRRHSTHTHQQGKGAYRPSRMVRCCGWRWG